MPHPLTKIVRNGIWIGPAIVVLVLGAWQLADALQRANSVGIQVTRHALPDVVPESEWPYKPQTTTADVLSQLNEATQTAEVTSNRAPNVRTGRFLQLDARVRELNGVPVAAARVLFEWHIKGKTERFVRYSDAEGRASVQRFVTNSEYEKPAVIMVTARTPRWSASRYTWYIAE